MRPAVAEALERAHTLGPKAGLEHIYGRICEQAGNDAEEVLAIVATRHPAASWLLPLAERYERVPGILQLAAAQTHGAFQAVCWACAKGGFVEALIDAGRHGRPEPAAALLAHGQRTAAVESASRALDANPECAIVAWFSSV